jgi:hypothetical protein
MNCTHALGLIDAGPFVLSRPKDIEEAMRHADACPACRQARDVTRTLDARLERWPSAELPHDLSAGVMTRIAAIERARAEAVATAGEVAPLVREHQWAPLAVAGAVTVGAAVTSLVDGHVSFTAAEPLGHIAASVSMSPAHSAGVLAVVGSLLLYAVGLFAPLRSSRRESR